MRGAGLLLGWDVCPTLCAGAAGQHPRPVPCTRAFVSGLWKVEAAPGFTDRAPIPRAWDVSEAVLTRTLLSCSHDVFPPRQPAVQHHLGVLHGGGVPDHGRVQHVSAAWPWPWPWPGPRVAGAVGLPRPRPQTPSHCVLRGFPSSGPSSAGGCPPGAQGLQRTGSRAQPDSGLMGPVRAQGAGSQAEAKRPCSQGQGRLHQTRWLAS